MSTYIKELSKDPEFMKLKSTLKNDPIFAMSLGSKELFHSNFWAWLFERDIAYARIFFPDIKPYDKVEREQSHRDLTIWNKEIRNSKNTVIGYEEAYVIENKLKSLPRLEQLEGYQNDIETRKNKNTGEISASGQRLVKGVITGFIKKPAFIDAEKNTVTINGKEWRFISYSEISEGIKKVANEVEANDEENRFDKEIIIKYAEMIKNLEQFAYPFLNSSKNIWPRLNEYVDFSNIRLDDVLKKLKAQELADYMRDHLKLTPCVAGKYNLTIATGFSNAHPIVDIRYVQEEDPESLSEIGIQIEGKQYRWVVMVKKKLNDKEKVKFFKEYRDDIHWFHNIYKEKRNGKDRKMINHFGEAYPTGIRADYGKYEGNSQNPGTFLYQWVNIEDKFDNNISFETLINMVQADMEAAVNILEDNMKK